jgi:hypothetical protein
MTIDKRINYIAQDGVKNYIKNSQSVTVPKKFKARKNAPATKLAYITADEAKMLKKMKKGTPHKGPKNIPSYDSFDAQGGFTSGAAMSAAETGSTNSRDRSEVQASNIGAPSGAGPGVKTQAEQDLRSSVIAAGAGQRVNPGFFDSRDTVSPFELAGAKAFNPTAFSQNRRGGIMDFITSGGILGNVVRGVGQKFGLGKRYNEPTYNMSQFSGLPVGGSSTFKNLDIRDKFNRTEGLSDVRPVQTFEFDPTNFNNTANYEATKYDFDEIDNQVAELTDKQKAFINNQKTAIELGSQTPQDVYNKITNPNYPIYKSGILGFGEQEPTTVEEYNNYLQSIGINQRIV